ncbi:MAG: DUF790 family protein [Halobacteria archaeon]
MTLPKELLVLRFQGDRVQPGFALLSDANREAAQGLISVFRESVGKRRAELEAALDAGEPPGTTAPALRFRKSLVVLLERRSRFEVESAVEPAAARRALFGAAGGPVADAEKRAALLSAVASDFSTSAEALDASLWADLDSETVLRGFDPPPPDDLLREFNRELIHTLLQWARGAAVDGDLEAVASRARALGLEAAFDQGRVQVSPGRGRGPERTDGLARLFDQVASLERWSWSSEIVMPRSGRSGRRGPVRGAPRPALLALDDSLRPLLLAPGPPPVRPSDVAARVVLGEDVIPVASLAAGSGVEPEALARSLQARAPEYLRAGDLLVKRSFAEALRARLPRKGSVADLCRQASAAGVVASPALLEAMGYRVRWSGLDPRRAVAVADPEE